MERGTETAAALTVCPLTGGPGLKAAGEVTLGTYNVWEAALDRAVREGADVCCGGYVLELSALTFVDVGGAGALAAAARRMPAGRRIVLHRPPPALRRVLEMFWPDHPAIEVSKS
ncbi:STAS domain-containing protein [Streptomyces griseosporeus]|uniref:STAS domain-containing protein n=1 Tax=Streptomyces griseosporeus TaxID=1910 RepID=UPI0036C40AB6